ncbi:23918_t:CDS:2, partial [Gigaspora margarita]
TKFVFLSKETKFVFLSKETKFVFLSKETKFDSNNNVFATQLWGDKQKDFLDKVPNIKQFFHLNDIDINGTKFKLAIINTKQLPNQCDKVFGVTRIVAEKNLSDIKF